MEGRVLYKATTAAITRFLYKDIIYRYSVFIRLIKDGGPENKDLVD